ncbi:MAG: DUF4097 family beta strand repeat-containing protein [Gemmatimonadaceae bacterium]
MAALVTLQIAHTDTTVVVRAGARLAVDLRGGSIDVRTWDRGAVRVVAAHSEQVAVHVESTAAVLSVRSAAARGRNNIVDYQITVPRAMSLTLGGGDIDITVAGSEAEIAANNREGKISVNGGRGVVSLRSTHGEVAVANARARIEVHALNGDIAITDAIGDIEAENADGSITLTRVDAARVSATTVDGEIYYEGPIRDGGRYSFTTHDNEVRLVIPGGVNATVTVATVTGEFHSDFPYEVREQRGRGRFSFVLGNGSALLELESFEGDIKLGRRDAPSRREER